MILLNTLGKEVSEEMKIVLGFENVTHFRIVICLQNLTSPLLLLVFSIPLPILSILRLFMALAILLLYKV